MKFPAWYGILVGFLMIAQWTVSIFAGGVPEFQSEPWRIAFHLAAEFSTAMMLIIGGIAVLKSMAWSKQILMLGRWPLVIYDVVDRLK